VIFRRRHTANYTTISNLLFDDNRLAADEIGILAYLLSRPHDWEVRRPALQRRWGIGREAMRRIMFSWIKYGWCHPSRTRLPNGTFYVLYDIRDLPGPELTDEEVRRALSLESSEATLDDAAVKSAPEEVSEIDSPGTGQPYLADPSPANPATAKPPPAYIDKPNTDSPRTDSPRPESDQKSERERERGREKHALNLAEFKRRWPTAASDDQARIDEAWFALSLEEGQAALAGVVAFLDKLKADKRSTVPAGWKYLREKRWTLLAVPKAATSSGEAAPDSGPFEIKSDQARAIQAVYAIARTRPLVVNGRVIYPKPLSAQLLAFAQLPPQDEWIWIEDRQQTAAWSSFLAAHVAGGRPQLVTTRGTGANVRNGFFAPWPWPPRKDGTISSAGEAA
jgi:hypothetical protein